MIEPQPIETAKNGAHYLLARAEARLAAGEIDESRWYDEVSAAIVPAYLSASTPCGQSGKSGDLASWEYGRSLIAEAVDRDGTFLDVGCANGFLMECLPDWCAVRGASVEPYGLDISPELADLARWRLPHWKHRIFVGNAIDWTPPRRFDFVRTGLEYVPVARQPDLVRRLLDQVAGPYGRLIVGVTNEEIERAEMAERLAAWGFVIAGSSQRPHRDPRLAYRIVWIDAPGR